MRIPIMAIAAHGDCGAPLRLQRQSGGQSLVADGLPDLRRSLRGHQSLQSHQLRPEQHWPRRRRPLARQGPTAQAASRKVTRFPARALEVSPRTFHARFRPVVATGGGLRRVSSPRPAKRPAIEIVLEASLPEDALECVPAAIPTIPPATRRTTSGSAAKSR
jgi:hypothetical protein